MTPKRKAYLAKCSKREKDLRLAIYEWKLRLKETKMACQPYKKNKRFKRKPFGYCVLLAKIQDVKRIMNALRHELARLKGMDRVTMPYVQYRFGFSENVPKVSYYCECFTTLNRQNNYCPVCGRRILWEKVE